MQEAVLLTFISSIKIEYKKKKKYHLQQLFQMEVDNRPHLQTNQNTTGNYSQYTDRSNIVRTNTNMAYIKTGH